MLCKRCARDKACSEAECVAFAQRRGPPLPAGICFQCAWEDPQYHDRLLTWTCQRRDQVIRPLRDLAAHLLEAIDRLVERFR